MALALPLCLSNHLTAPPMECLAVICPWLHLGCPSGRTQEVQQPPDRLYLWEQERRDMGNYRLLCSRRPPFREFRWVPHLGHGNCHFPPICPPVFRKKIFFSWPNVTSQALRPITFLAVPSGMACPWISVPQWQMRSNNTPEVGDELKTEHCPAIWRG